MKNTFAGSYATALKNTNLDFKKYTTAIYIIQITQQTQFQLHLIQLLSINAQYPSQTKQKGRKNIFFLQKKTINILLNIWLYPRDPFIKKT